MVFAHMSPLIQNTMRTPTEVSRIVMLTGIPIRKFFNLQWLPNSDDFLQTNAGMTATASKRSWLLMHILAASEFSEAIGYYLV